MKERYGNYIMYGLLGLAIIALISAVYSYSGRWDAAGGGVSISNAVGNIDETFESVDSGSTEFGDVSIELTPYETTNNQLTVGIAVNTHSVDLSHFDLKQITTLEYDGETVRPVSAPSLSGHHSNGELIFNIEKELDLFTIKIEGIPKIEERIFTWQINKK